MKGRKRTIISLSLLSKPSQVNLLLSFLHRRLSLSSARLGLATLVTAIRDGVVESGPLDWRFWGLHTRIDGLNFTTGLNLS